ncbi:class I SAM-dependent methyltransferase [uncultured Sphingomonas sp.]|uniref:class I SAM-dependent methyltransferase n=1 Tax=uncultured Sphingomonas sp. TaxID=158754 RepID=UPI0035CB1882
MSDAPAIEPGGSAPAIRHHYDVGNDFYAAWLDPSMTYSSAMWDGLPDDASLEAAQARKLRYHAEALGAGPGMRILDIGCGWGSMMRTLIGEFGARECVGLTMSEQQAAAIAANQPAGIQVVLRNWHDFTPDGPFDGVVSIGAFEHFAHPEQSVEERREIYRRFFKSCLDWTNGGGRLSLQTIAYGTMRPAESNPFITEEIFPAAELPTLEDIVVASDGLFHIMRLRNDGRDYARTCEIWARQLRAAAARGEVPGDPELIARYQRYLLISAAGFRMRRIDLLRIRFDPIKRSTYGT